MGYRWKPLKDVEVTLIEAGWDYIPNRGLKEVDDLFVLLVIGITSHVEGRRTRSMLGELRKFDGQALNSWLVMVQTSCAQRSVFGAPRLIQYLFTEIQELKRRKSENDQIHIL